MVRYPGHWPLTSSYIPYDWDILATFFQNHDIVPVWINCHYTWGWYDEESGKWTGAVGKVGRKLRTMYKNGLRTYFLPGQIEEDEADMAVYGFACTYERTMVALCLPGLNYQPFYWFTK